MENVSLSAYRCTEKIAAFRAAPVLLILSTAEDISGGEIFLLSLVEKVHSWTPVVATPNPELARRCRSLGVQAVLVRGLRSLRREHLLLALWRLCFFQSAALLRLLSLAVQLRADAIMSASFSGAHFAFALSRLLNRPGFWSHQHPVLKPGDANSRIASWLLAKGGMSVVACSHAVARSLGPSGLRNENVTVITKYVDVSHFQRGLPSFCAQRAAGVGLVAMITPWKQEHLLIGGSAAAEKSRPTKNCSSAILSAEFMRIGKMISSIAMPYSQRLTELWFSQQAKFRGKQRNMEGG